MKRKLVLLLGVMVAATLALGAARDPAGVDRAARDAWARILAAGGEVRALSDPIAVSGVLVTNTANTPVVGLIPMPDLTGAIAWGNPTGITTETGIKGLAGVGPTGEGYLGVRSTTGTLSYLLDGNAGLQSVAGDLAESFPAPAGGIEPGMVVVIDAARTGGVLPSSRPYDRMVAGVVAGAPGHPSAITLRALDPQPHKVPIALTGTVPCRAVGPIHAGDLLTTSAVPGHAMRATDPAAAQGAILGKALEDLQGDRGTILILASLQ
jgi:hypothetical protein